MTSHEKQTAERQARRRARYLTGLLWHIGTFLIVNGFFWLMDLTLGAGGAQWAPWITAAWGFALLFHLLAWLIAGCDIEGRKAAEYQMKATP